MAAVRGHPARTAIPVQRVPTQLRPSLSSGTVRFSTEEPNLDVANELQAPAAGDARVSSSEQSAAVPPGALALRKLALHKR